MAAVSIATVLRDFKMLIGKYGQTTSQVIVHVNTFRFRVTILFFLVVNIVNGARIPSREGSKAYSEQNLFRWPSNNW